MIVLHSKTTERNDDSSEMIKKDEKVGAVKKEDLREENIGNCPDNAEYIIRITIELNENAVKTEM